MDISIRTILQDLQSGALTKEQARQAMERLKARPGDAGILFVVPRWKAVSPASYPVQDGARFAAHSILLGDFPALIAEEMEKRLAGSQVSRLPDPKSNPAETYREIALACFDHVRRILKSRPRKKVLLQVLAPDEPSGRLILALAGMLKSAAMEEPNLTARILLAPSDMRQERLLGLLESDTGNIPVTCLKLDQDGLKTLAWEEAESGENSPPLPYREDGVYLITGGLGRLGSLFAEDILAKTTRAKVVLTGRAPISDAVRSRLEALCPRPGRVEYLRMDPEQGSRTEAAIAGLLKDAGRLDGVLHAAGMVRDNFIVKKSREEFLEVLAPKVTGAWNLDRATRNADLDFFALFSSGASAVGNAGQADYAAANGFMDHFASLRAAMVETGERKGKTLSINWPLWKDGGLKVGEAEERQLRETFGMQALETPAGLGAFARCLNLGSHQAVVAAGNPAKLRKWLFSETPAGRPIERPDVMAGDTSANTDDLAAWTVEYLRRELAAVLGVGYHDLDAEAPLEKYGINSILAMSLTNKLETLFGALPKTLFFEYQTIRDLAAYFIEAHADALRRLASSQVPANKPPRAADGRAAAPKAEGMTNRPTRRPARRLNPRPAREAEIRDEDPIAIIGLSGRYPESLNLSEFWENLRLGKDCVTEVPRERWDWKEFYSEDRTQAGRHYSKWGGFIAGADEFDPRFFNISIKEAEHIDPQERIFLQHAWAALEDAGYTRSALRPSLEGEGAVGVYVGVMYSDYQLFGAGGSDAEGNPLPIGASHASIANRVSYFLDLHGPSLSLDTMCSSSLSAIHLACQDLKGGRTSMAIAGGVNLTLHPHKYLVLSNGQFISSHGHCQSFGEGGDGYIPGEGVGAVILKRLSEARRDGDPIHGIIRGSALNHGGKTNGYSVPNPVAQAQVIRMAMREAGVDPRCISYVEAHGTGTKLGDPIEIAALTKVFQESSRDAGYCLIGSAKSNIGHCESAAGIAGLTKVLLQMKHGQIAPSLHSTRLNPNIDFEATPFVVNQTLQDWKRPVVDGVEHPRLAALSSFGAGGSNAHIVLQEFVVPAETRPEADREDLVAVPLSARTEEQLRQKALDLAEHLRSKEMGRGGEATELQSIAYTLQVGREAMDKRLAILAGSREQLRQRLLLFAERGTEGVVGAEGIFQAKQKADRDTLAMFTADADLRETLHKWMEERKYPRLLELWVKGLDLDWRRLHGEGHPMKANLPTYPFARERCWFRGRASRGNAAGTGLQGAIHPFLHRNTSSFGRQSYTSILAETGIHLPFICLEMASAAIAHASGKAPGAPVLLEKILWGEAPALDRNAPVHIELVQGGENRIEFEIHGEAQGEEFVLCQGMGSLDEQAAPRLDFEGLKASLIPCRGREATEGQPALGIDPTMIQGVLETVLARHGGAGRPSFTELASARILAPAVPEGQAWIRPSESSPNGLDLDLAEASGKVTLEIRGLAFAAAASPSSADPVPEPLAPQAAPLRISLDHDIPASFDETEAEIAPARTESITLVTLSDLSPADGSSRTAPCSNLPAMVHEGQGGIFNLSLPDLPDTPMAFESLLLDAKAALEDLGAHPSIKALKIEASGKCLPGKGEQALDAMRRHRLGQAMAAFPFPIIVVAKGDALGAAFLWAAYGDIPVFDASGRYAFTDAADGILPTTAEWLFFKARFGASFAERFLLESHPVDGTALGEMGLTAAILPPREAEEFAETLARDLAGKPREALRLLKQHLSREWRNAGQDALALAVPVADRVSAPEAAEHGAGEFSLPLPHDRHGNGAIILRTADFPTATDPGDVLALLREVFIRIAGHRENRAIILDCSGAILPGTESAFPPSLLVDFQHLVEGCPLPILAVLRAGMIGPAWLPALLCDGTVWNEEEDYGCGNTAASDLYRMAWTLLSNRFGEDMARNLLVARETCSGKVLAAGRSAFGRVAAEDALLTEAIVLAGEWRTLPWENIRAWKKLPSLSAEAERREEADMLPGPLEKDGSAEPSLRTSVIRVDDLGDGVVLLAMEDKANKNMFSPRLVGELSDAFARIDRSPSCRAVILTGFDTFFASGGTKETLLEIQHGESRFTDSQTFQSALRCRVPVIAAMQGHAIGAGWVLGLMADFVLFSEESRYRSPYMNYGFTPGAGATLVLPARLGEDLAFEGLYTGREYSGREIKARSRAIRLTSRTRILDQALTLAIQIAALPLERLLALKRLWSRPFAAKLEACCRLEVEMHDKTLVGNSQALRQIEATFPRAEEMAKAAPETRQPDRAVHSLEAVLGKLRTLLAAELLIGEHEIEEETEFVELGLDSVTGVTWIRRINEAYGTSIEATKIYSHPTLSKLGRYVAQQIPAQAAPEKAMPEKAEATKPSLTKAAISLSSARESALPRLVSRRSRWRDGRKVAGAAAGMTEPIAVIGMAGQFPSARDTEAFWKNIAAGKNCITEVDPERWSLERHYQEGAPKAGKTYSKWLGALEAYDRFDPMFFNISPLEAEIMDPQQRLFLQSSWHAIEDAGYNPQSLSGSRCGVFVGCAGGDYHQASKEHELSAHGFTGSATSILAARISYFLNLRGPSLAIETACSSSLVAIANACDSLNAGNSDLALAGGVYVMTGPGLHIKTSQAGMLSPDGRCYTFDQRANGFVPGEAVGTLLLKRLSDARRDGDAILGIIRGWGMNQDGKTNGITAPNAESQKQLELDVYRRFGIDPSRIQLVEAHGTGTKMGDPIEVEALKESFRVHTRREGFCAIGSIKSNIGHCLTAAGIAGFIKVLLALRRRQLPPTIHFKDLNEHINLAGSPFYVNAVLAPWDIAAGEERLAAISAFGFSGTNAHLVIGEGTEPETPAGSAAETQPGQDVLVPLSARSLDRLERKVADHLDFLEDAGRPVSLPSLAYVLQVGREPMEHRVAFLAGNVGDLKDRMRAYLEKKEGGTGCFTGSARRNAPHADPLLRDRATRDAAAEEWIKRGELSKLAAAWANGLDFDWNRLQGKVKPAKARLPLYPFAEERYWLSASSHGKEEVPAQTRATAAHPLLHKKTADLLLQAPTPWISKDGTVDPAGLGRNGAARAPVRRIPLPTYPFAKDRCWPEETAETALAWKEKGSRAGDQAIEQLFDQIERQSIGSREAAKMLQDLP